MMEGDVLFEPASTSVVSVINYVRSVICYVFVSVYKREIIGEASLSSLGGSRKSHG